MITSGEVKNQTDLAQKLGIFKVHVCRILSLLKLNDELIEAVEKMKKMVEELRKRKEKR
jgi:hypothetical protein